MSRIDPLKGAQRLFSLTNVVRLGFGVFKIAIVSAVAAWCVLDHYDEILALSTHDVARNRRR